MINESKIIVEVNRLNQLSIDVSEYQMIRLFINKHKRPPKNRLEAEAFLQLVIANQLIKRGLIKRIKK
jgi:phosphate starvation-inducible membrane PsiE